MTEGETAHPSASPYSPATSAVPWWGVAKRPSLTGDEFLKSLEEEPLETNRIDVARDGTGVPFTGYNVATRIIAAAPRLETAKAATRKADGRPTSTTPTDGTRGETPLAVSAPGSAISSGGVVAVGAVGVAIGNERDSNRSKGEKRETAGGEEASQRETAGGEEASGDLPGGAQRRQAQSPAGPQEDALAVEAGAHEQARATGESKSAKAETSPRSGEATVPEYQETSATGAAPPGSASNAAAAKAKEAAGEEKTSSAAAILETDGNTMPDSEEASTEKVPPPTPTAVVAKQAANKSIELPAGEEQTAQIAEAEALAKATPRPQITSSQEGSIKPEVKDLAAQEASEWAPDADTTTQTAATLQKETGATPEETPADERTAAAADAAAQGDVHDARDHESSTAEAAVAQEEAARPGSGETFAQEGDAQAARAAAEEATGAPRDREASTAAIAAEREGIARTTSKATASSPGEGAVLGRWKAAQGPEETRGLHEASKGERASMQEEAATPESKTVLAEGAASASTADKEGEEGTEATEQRGGSAAGQVPMPLEAASSKEAAAVAPTVDAQTESATETSRGRKASPAKGDAEATAGAAAREKAEKAAGQDWRPMAATAPEAQQQATVPELGETPAGQAAAPAGDEAAQEAAEATEQEKVPVTSLSTRQEGTLKETSKAASIKEADAHEAGATTAQTQGGPSSGTPAAAPLSPPANKAETSESTASAAPFACRTKSPATLGMPAEGEPSAVSPQLHSDAGKGTLAAAPSQTPKRQQTRREIPAAAAEETPTVPIAAATQAVSSASLPQETTAAAPRIARGASAVAPAASAAPTAPRISKDLAQAPAAAAVAAAAASAAGKPAPQDARETALSPSPPARGHIRAIAIVRQRRTHPPAGNFKVGSTSEAAGGPHGPLSTTADAPKGHADALSTPAMLGNGRAPKETGGVSSVSSQASKKKDIGPAAAVPPEAHKHSLIAHPHGGPHEAPAGASTRPAPLPAAASPSGGGPSVVVLRYCIHPEGACLPEVFESLGASLVTASGDLRLDLTEEKDWQRVQEVVSVWIQRSYLPHPIFGSLVQRCFAAWQVRHPGVPIQWGLFTAASHHPTPDKREAYLDLFYLVG